MKPSPVDLTHFFLQHFNPLRGLDMSKVVTLLEEGERGAYTELQWLYRFIEKRDAVLRGSKRQILNSIKKLNWEVKISSSVPEGMQTRAEEQQQALMDAYEQIENLREALDFLCLAEFRGFSHLEKHYGEGGDAPNNIVRLNPVPQWHIVRDGLYGEWNLNAQATIGQTTGDALELEHYVFREVQDPINEIAAICFVRKGLSQKDWDRFVEKFGVPFVFWVLSEQVAAQVANDEKKLTAWQGLMDQIGSDGSGIFPGGSLETLDTSGGQASNPFSDHLKYQDEQIVIAATSGKLTMLNEATGLGSGQSDSHRETFDDVAMALALDLSETLQRQIDKPILEQLFPGEKHYAYFELEAQDEEDRKEVIEAAKGLHDIGLKVSAEEMAEKTGFNLQEADSPQSPDDGDPSPGGEAPSGEEDDDPVAAQNTEPTADEVAILQQGAREKIYRAFSSDLQPLSELIDTLTNADEETFQKEAKRISKDLLGMDEVLLNQVGGADALYETMLEALTEGLGR